MVGRLASFLLYPFKIPLLRCAQLLKENEDAILSDERAAGMVIFSEQNSATNFATQAPLWVYQTENGSTPDARETSTEELGSSRE